MFSFRGTYAKITFAALSCVGGKYNFIHSAITLGISLYFLELTLCLEDLFK